MIEVGVGKVFLYKAESVEDVDPYGTKNITHSEITRAQKLKFKRQQSPLAKPAACAAPAHLDLRSDVRTDAGSPCAPVRESFRHP